MNHSGAPGIRAVDVWDVLRSAITTSRSIGEWTQQLARLTEFDSLGLLFFVRAATIGADTTDGAGAIAHGEVGSGLPLHSRLSTGNVIDNDTFSVIANHNIFTRDRRPGGVGGTLVFELEFQLEQITLQTVRMGLLPTPGLPLALHALGFLHDPGVSPNWYSETYAAALEAQDTGIVADTDFHIFRFEKTATAIRFYIDGALVTTHVTQIPDVGDQGQTGNLNVGLRTEAAVAKHAKYSYVALWNE